MNSIGNDFPAEGFIAEAMNGAYDAAMWDTFGWPMDRRKSSDIDRAEAQVSRAMAESGIPALEVEKYRAIAAKLLAVQQAMKAFIDEVYVTCPECGAAEVLEATKIRHESDCEAR